MYRMIGIYFFLCSQMGTYPKKPVGTDNPLRCLALDSSRSSRFFPTWSVKMNGTNLAIFELISMNIVSQNDYICN